MAIASCQVAGGQCWSWSGARHSGHHSTTHVFMACTCRRTPSSTSWNHHAKRIPHTSHLGATQPGHGSSHYASLQYSVSAGASLRSQWQGNDSARVTSGTAVIPITRSESAASTQRSALWSSWLGAVLYTKIAKAFSNQAAPVGGIAKRYPFF